MAPNCNNTNIYAAVKEISTSLSGLRREHCGTKTAISTLFDQILSQQRHMNRIDELIDEHQTKIDALMHLVVSSEQNSTSSRGVSEEVRTSAVEQDPLQVPVSDRSTTSVPVSDNANWLVGSETQNSDSLDSNSQNDAQPQTDRKPSVVVRIKSENMDVSNEPVPSNFAGQATTSTMDAAAEAGWDWNATMFVSQHGFDESEPATSEGQSIGNESNESHQQTQGPQQQQQQLEQQQQPQSQQQQDQQQQPPQQQPQLQIRLQQGGNNVTLTTGDPVPTLYKVQPVKTFTCKNPKTLKILTTYLAAARYHDANGTVKFRCCNYVYSSRSDCERHVISKHTDERPYKCDVCSYATTRKDGLAKHKANGQHHHYQQR